MQVKLQQSVIANMSVKLAEGGAGILLLDCLRFLTNCKCKLGVWTLVAPVCHVCPPQPCHFIDLLVFKCM